MVSLKESLTTTISSFQSTATTPDPSPAPPPSCNVCNDTGRWTGIQEYRDGRRVLQSDGPCPVVNCLAGARERIVYEQEQIARLFGQAEFPWLYRDANLLDFEPVLVEKAVAALGKHRGLILSGPVGVGKTRFLVATLKEAITHQEPGLYLTVADLLATIKSTFNRPRDYDGPTEHDLLDKAATIAWLGFDDMGAEVGTPWVQQELFQIVNTRYAEGRPIIGTTNLTPGELAQSNRLGNRIVSRLMESCDWLTMAGPDRRLGL